MKLERNSNGEWKLGNWKTKCPPETWQYPAGVSPELIGVVPPHLLNGPPYLEDSTFVIDGEYILWKNMTKSQKNSLKKQKITIAQCCKDAAMETKWENIQI